MVKVFKDSKEIFKQIWQCVRKTSVEEFCFCQDLGSIPIRDLFLKISIIFTTKKFFRQEGNTPPISPSRYAFNNITEHYMSLWSILNTCIFTQNLPIQSIQKYLICLTKLFFKIPLFINQRCFKVSCGRHVKRLIEGFRIQVPSKQYMGIFLIFYLLKPLKNRNLKNFSKSMMFIVGM